MQICPKHWDQIREALKERGLEEFGAKSGQQAIAAVVTELEGRGAENDFDPLMACNNLIFSQSLKVCGLGLMAMNEDGSHKCPICEALASYEKWLIEGPANSMQAEAKEKGLIP